MPADWHVKQLDNRNYLSPVGFKLKLDIFPGVDFLCQSASIPGTTAQVTEFDTPRRPLAVPSGGGTRFDDLTISFLVDEDLKNYLSIWNWINKTTNAYEPDTDDDAVFSTGQLFVLTNNYNANFVVNFDSLFPTQLSTLPFNVGSSDVEYLVGTVTFKYAFYEFLNMESRKYEP